jgi:hypothetical protein
MAVLHQHVEYLAILCTTGQDTTNELKCMDYTVWCSLHFLQFLCDKNAPYRSFMFVNTQTIKITINIF